MIVSIWRSLWSLSADKQSTSSLKFSLRYCKDIANLLFWDFGHAWLHTLSVMLSPCRKLSCLSSGKKTASSPMLFWRYYKEIQTSYFGYFGHVWLYTPKMILFIYRRLQCLSACQKYFSSFTSFLRYYILKNPAIWLADSIFAYNLRTRILPDMALVVKCKPEF